MKTAVLSLGVKIASGHSTSAFEKDNNDNAVPANIPNGTIVLPYDSTSLPLAVRLFTDNFTRSDRRDVM